MVMPWITKRCEYTSIQFDVHPEDEPYYKLLSLVNTVSEFMPKRLLVLCNIYSYLTDTQWYELMKYICYTKVCVLDIESSLPDRLYDHEIRWIFSEDYDDEIRKS